MPLNAFGWTTEEDEKLAELVKPHTLLYSVFDSSRKNILARESTWKEIAQGLGKPVEECKKRWRGLRDGYMRNKRVGAIHKKKVGIFEKLQFLDGFNIIENNEDVESIPDLKLECSESPVEEPVEEEEVITDKQEYYITLVEKPTEPQQASSMPQMVKILPAPPKLVQINYNKAEIPKKRPGRKRNVQMPRNIPPVKILPKPTLVMNNPNIIKYVEEQKTTDRQELIDSLIEKVLKESTNEIDVFFKSMAATVKNMQPSLIPKVKMEVCNVVAKYEMQSFEKRNN